MQMPSISASASLINRADGWCGTKVPGLPPQPGPDPFAKLTGLLDKLGLNPQPLPPKGMEGGAGGLARLLDDFCGTVPRGPFPPPPSLPGLGR